MSGILLCPKAIVQCRLDCPPLIGSEEPHAQETVGKAVNLGAAEGNVIVGEELFAQEGAGGVLDGTGGF